MRSGIQMTRRQVLIAGVIVGCIFYMTIRGAGAAEWSAVPTLSTRGDYNSNLLLTDQPHKAVWGNWLSPGMTYTGSTENLEIGGRAAADFVSYYGEQETSYANFSFPLSAKYRGERDRWSVDGGFTRDNTLMGELQKTGVVLAFTQRNLWTASPSWTHNLTERTDLVAGYQFSDAAYENGLSLGLVDYQVHAGNAGVSYKIADMSMVQLTGIASLFRAPQRNLESKIFGVQVSLNHELSETFSVKLEAGPRFINNVVQSGPQDLSDHSVVWVANATIRKQLERTAVTFDASRQINPSGFGLLLETDRIGLTIGHQLTENLSASITGQAILSTATATVGSVASFPQQRYVSAQPRLTWKINDWWGAEAWYSYGQRDVDSLNVTAMSNAVSVAITYTPAKFSVGR
jgi:hypothetical protein